MASKIWWPISTGFEAAQARGEVLWFGYHMSIGPRMGTTAYFVQALVVASALVILARLVDQASTFASGDDSLVHPEESH